MTERDQALMLASIASYKREQPPKRAESAREFGNRCHRCGAPTAAGSAWSCLKCLERNRNEARERRGHKGDPRGRKIITK